MPIAYVGIGSNIEPEENVRAALRLLAQRAAIVAVSTFHRTQPLGGNCLAPFYNGVAKLETDLSPRALKFEVLRQIETALGRRRGHDKYSPRTIDLDIIIYDDVVANEPDLVIPDPDIATREFVALPLLELCPGLVIPGVGIALAPIAANMSGDSMQPLEEFTRSLRESCQLSVDG